MPICTFRFTLAPTDGAETAFTVRLTTERGQTATAPFQFDLSAGSRLLLQVESMRDGIVTYDQLQDVGANLFKGLVNGDVARLFDAEREEAEQASAVAAATVPPESRDPLQFVLRLELPVKVRHLPWECLYEEDREFGFLLNGTRYSLIRETFTGAIPPRPGPAGRVRMLVVVPQGSNLNVERELHGLKSAVTNIGDDAVELSVLDGRVSPDRLRERVSEKVWDIVHFIGHGDIVDGRARVRLNNEDPEGDDLWVNGEIFATFFEEKLPRLVVLNCCHGGSQASQRSLSGLGPFLMRAGVAAVVAMQYEIPDSVAIRFAGRLYNAFLAGSAPGRIDRALAAARLSLFQNQSPDRPHSFMTPVLYLAAGHEKLLELTAAPRTAPAMIIVPRAVPQVLPEDLIEAFRDRRVVPVIGPELLSVGAMRGGAAAAPGPRELARQLAQDAGFPRMDDLLAGRPSEDFGIRILPEVCQHYERRKDRWKLLTAVQKVYKACQPPPGLVQVARWEVPGIVCSYFDGLLDEALANVRPFRSLHAVDQKAAGYRDETLVVHVRGVHDEDESVVLTERDEELLLERMADLSPQVTDLTRKSKGRSLLYLGVSPKDLLIRRLTRALRGNARSQGRMYFVRPETGEDAYWDEYDVHWLPMKLEDFLSAVGDSGVYA